MALIRNACIAALSYLGVLLTLSMDAKAELPRLFIVPFESQLRDQSPAIGDAVVDAFQHVALAQPQTPWQLLERRGIQAQLRELSLSESALADPSQALRIGRLLSAPYILRGNVSQGKIHTSKTTKKHPIPFTWATVQVQATLIATETGAVLYSGRALGISQRYPNWQGDTFTSIIAEAVDVAVKHLAEDLIQQYTHRSRH